MIKFVSLPDDILSKVVSELRVPREGSNVVFCGYCHGKFDRFKAAGLAYLKRSDKQSAL